MSMRTNPVVDIPGPMATPGEAAVDVSVVCPFYNEEKILESAVRRLLARLEAMEESWELLIVNDGSTDGSGEIAARLAAGHERLRCVGYTTNRGRGYALRTGIGAARGAVVITTEIDLSWGEDIVERLLAAMNEWPDADIVVASPHLPGGGYRNVPGKRVFLSRFGNHVIRACMSQAVTMNTGMTRAYRRGVIRSLPLREDRKQFHLEVLLKATALGYRVREIPTVLEWLEYKHEGRRVKRKSASQLRPVIKSHTLFSLFAEPLRYVWAMSLAALFVGMTSLVWAIVLTAQGEVSVYMALLSVLMVILSIVLFVLGVVLQQGNAIQRELWMTQRQLNRLPGMSEADERVRDASPPPPPRA